MSTSKLTAMFANKLTDKFANKRIRRQAGLSMVELVLFIVIVGIAVAGILMVMIQSNKASADPQLRKQAISIAEGLLEEIQLARFTYCDPGDDNADTADSIDDCSVPEIAGPEPGNDRPYDNVNDYVTAYGQEESFPLIDLNKNPVGDLAPYTAFLTITPESLGSGTGLIASNASAAGNEVLRIRVRVRYASEDVVLDGYRTRYAPNAVP
jgi:MSHA pilin protein MshD